MIASLYAAEFPNRVETLVLVAPAPLLVLPAEGGGLFEAVGKRLPEGMRADYANWQKRYLDFQNVFSKSEAELAAVNAEFARYYTAVATTSVPEQGQGGGWMVYAMYFSMGQRHDYRAALKEVKAPVLVLHGANDLQTEKESRTYVEAFPNARLQVIANAGHFAFHEQPEPFAAVVGGFLSELK